VDIEDKMGVSDVKQNVCKNPSPGEPMASETGTGPKVSSGAYIVARALCYMKENYRKHLTLTGVAEQMFVSQWHLSKLLNRHTGKNFSELLNRVRIDEAIRLLADPSRRVGDIAVEVGFSDSAHFCHVFKRQVGISAGEYRVQLEKGIAGREG
jgi:two-component system response regulator YesN